MYDLDLTVANDSSQSANSLNGAVHPLCVKRSQWCVNDDPRVQSAPANAIRRRRNREQVYHVAPLRQEVRSLEDVWMASISGRYQENAHLLGLRSCQA
jgi:hypothetical protein